MQTLRRLLPRTRSQKLGKQNGEAGSVHGGGAGKDDQQQQQQPGGGGSPAVPLRTARLGLKGSQDAEAAIAEVDPDSLGQACDFFAALFRFQQTVLGQGDGDDAGGEVEHPYELFTGAWAQHRRVGSCTRGPVGGAWSRWPCRLRRVEAGNVWT